MRAVEREREVDDVSRSRLAPVLPRAAIHDRVLGQRLVVAHRGLSRAIGVPKVLHVAADLLRQHVFHHRSVQRHGAERRLGVPVDELLASRNRGVPERVLVSRHVHSLGVGEVFTREFEFEAGEKRRGARSLVHVNP